jgi:hypothetical protein
MPTVRRAERTVVHDPLRGGMKQAAATAQSEGAGVEIARAEKFGAAAQLGERVTRLGASMFAGIMEEERQKADQTALLKASNALSDWKNKRLYHPTEGALNLKGEASLPIPEDIRAEFTEVAGGIEAGLSTDAQRAAFARLKSQEWEGIDLTVRRHVFQEMNAFRAQELQAHVENSVNTAIASAADPKLVQVELQKAVSALEANLPSFGLGKDAIDQKVRETQSQVHVGVIANLLAKENDKGAEAYFAATRDQIAGKDLDNVTRAIEEGSRRGESQRKADEIIAAGGTLREQREKAKDLDPKIRKEVEDRLEHQAVLDERDRRERLEGLERGAYDILDRNPDVSRIPPATWTQFDGPTRASLRSYAQAKAKGVPVETDLPTYYGLMQQAGNDPAGFAQVNLLQFKGRVGETEFKQLAGIQNAIKEGQRDAANKELSPFQTRSQLVDDTLAQHGINPNAKPNTAEGRAIAQLRRMVDLRVNILQADGKKASNQDIQAEIDGILSASTEVPGSWWNVFPGGKAGPFGTDKKRLIEATVEDIAPGERSKIEAALRARGRPVSDATVLDLYVETQLRIQRAGGK